MGGILDSHLYNPVETLVTILLTLKDGKMARVRLNNLSQGYS